MASARPEFAILLPPSEGKIAGGNPLVPGLFDGRSGTSFNFFNELDPYRQQLIAELQRTVAAGEALEQLFEVGGSFLAEAIQANLAVLDSPRTPALNRYSPGVMYRAMDVEALPTGARRRLLENTIIFSGMFGLLRPDDLVPNYRLRMDAVLPGIGKVAHFWRPFISPVLNRLLQGRTIWNLLPAAHAEAWEDAHTYARMIRVSFVVDDEGERKPLTHGVKALRGRLVHFIVREALYDPARLEEWDGFEGYRIDPAATTEDEDRKTLNVVMVKTI